MTPSRASTPAIALLQPDEVLAARTARFLERDGFRVVQAPSTAEAPVRLAEVIPDVSVVSLKLGDAALGLIRDLKSRDDRLPVILLVHSAEEAQVAAALETGADDYLCAP